MVHGVCENQPTKLQYILAVEQTPCTLKQIVGSLSKVMGSGRTREIPAEEFFLYKDATVKFFLYSLYLNVTHFFLAKTV